MRYTYRIVRLLAIEEELRTLSASILSISATIMNTIKLITIDIPKSKRIMSIETGSCKLTEPMVTWKVVEEEELQRTQTEIEETNQA